MNFLFFVLVLIFGILFYLLAYSLLKRHFHAIMFPLNPAAKLFLASILLGFGIALYHFCAFGYKLFDMFYTNHKVLQGVAFFALVIFLCFCFCVLMFRFVLVASKVLFRENEKAELIKGNLIIGGMQIVLFLFFISLLSEPVILLIGSMLSNR
ncbi:MAG: hypothetical protein EB023_06530 [Flavobacteriia bacterium]|nr:hypothetical protein [Flavobacteriia bacterium]